MLPAARRVRTGVFYLLAMGFGMACDENDWPKMACTPTELGRLRAAYEAGGEPGAVIGRTVEAATEALGKRVVFPPEGGQHNQWYQCDACQIGLETVDDTHHKCPSCSTVYSGYPYDNVIYERKLYGYTRDMNLCAWAFALTDDEAFAGKGREILLEFARKYNTYELHSANQGSKEDPVSKSGGHVFEQTLNEAAWTQDVVEAYDLLRASDLITPADHDSVRSFLMDLYRNIDRHKAGKSNWQTYHNAAFMMIGGILGDEKIVRQALDDPENGHTYQMATSVLPGGMWYENSWSYHFYTLGAVERILEAGRRLGLDLHADPRARSMYTVAMDYVMPDGTLPRFGDGTTTGPPGHRYESAYHAWKDRQFLAVLPEGPTWDSILYGRTASPERAPEAPSKSVLKEGSGHAILRVGASGEAAGAVLVFSPFGGFHGHFDKLSFVYFAHGRELGHDPGRARSQAYRLPVHKNWYRATTSHNAVMVDRTSQEGAAGRCELFYDNDVMAAAAAVTDEAYPGIVHRRLLVLRPGYLLVVDDVEASDGREHVFDWLYHNVGSGIASASATAFGDAPGGQGFEYLQDVRRGSDDGTIRAIVSMEGMQAAVVVGGEPGSEVVLGTGVGESIRDRVPMMAVSRRGANGRFVAAIEPIPDGVSPRVTDVRFIEADHGLTVEVGLADGSAEVHGWDADARARTVAGQVTTSKLVSLRVASGETHLLGEGG